MRYIIALTPLVICLLAHLASSASSPKVTHSPVAPVSIPVETNHYGNKLETEAKFMPLEKLLQNPQAYANKEVMVTGYVRQACKKKGCWMEIAPSSTNMQQGCRVTFKNYGFFVPRSSAGASAKLKGVVQLDKLDKTTVEHLESDGATFKNKASDGTAHEVRIVASGVELTTKKK